MEAPSWQVDWSNHPICGAAYWHTRKDWWLLVPGTNSGWFQGCSIWKLFPLHHATELSRILRSKEEYRKPVLFVYSDGGPNHRIMYVSVQSSLIVLFLSLDLDFICAVRTAPSHSWHNPVERIMLGLMREKGEDEFEKEAAKCNSLCSAWCCKERPNLLGSCYG